MIILFVHLERTRLRPAGYTQLSTGDRKGRDSVRSAIGDVMKQVLIIPLCPQADAALGCLQTMQGRGDIPDRGTRVESQVPSWSLRDSV